MKTKKLLLEKQFVKRLAQGLLALLLVVSGISVLPKETSAAETREVVTVTGNQYVEKLEIDDYKTNGTAPKPAKEEYKDWLFSGWYTASDCTTSIGTDVTSGTYYAKYVPADILSVMCQTSANTTSTTEYTNLRLVSTVGSTDDKSSLKYEKVGFQIKIDGYKMKDYSTVNVYKKITASEESGVAFNYEPTKFQWMSKYFITATITNIPTSLFETGIRVTPYWKTLDGTMVYGIERYVRVADGYQDVVNVPVRLYSDTTGQTGSITVDYDSTNYTYAGVDYGNGFSSSNVTLDSSATGKVVCTTTSAVADANGMLVNLKFTKNADYASCQRPVLLDDFQISGDTAGWNASCKVNTSMQAANTDGVLDADDLYEYGTMLLNNDTTNAASVSATNSGDDVAYTFALASGAIKVLRLDNLELDLDMFTHMRVRVKNSTAETFSNFRLYPVYEKTDGTLAGGLSGSNYVIDSTNGTGKGYVSTSTDSDGYVTVTFDLSILSDAKYLRAFGFGYVCKGLTQSIQSIEFLKTDGDFSAETLYTIARPMNDNGKTNDPHQTLLTTTDGTTTVKYNAEGLGSGGALKTIQVENVELNPAAYDTMTVRISSATTDATETLFDFTRLRLYLVQNAGGAMTKVVDTGSTYGNRGVDATTDGDVSADQVTTTWIDENGDIVVTFDLSGLEAWTSADTINGFAFAYVNEGMLQEIKDIQFSKTKGDFPAETLYALGNVDCTDSTKTLSKTLTTTSTKYTISGGYGGARGVYVSGISLKTAEYGTMMARIRSTGSGEFTRYRLYLSDIAGGEKVVECGAGTLNPELITVDAPDAGGWITVTIDLANLSEWNAIDTLTGFSLAYVNTDATQEVAEIQFTKTNDSFIGEQIYAAGKPVFNVKKVVVPDTSLTTQGAVAYDFTDVIDTSSSKKDGLGDATSRRSVYLENLSLETRRYDTMTVRIRDTEGTDFTNYVLFVALTEGDDLETEPLLSYKVAGVTTTTVTDSNNVTWQEVSFDLDTVEKWNEATNLSGLNFSWENQGAVQEISKIEFSLEQTIEVVYSASDYMSQRYAYRLCTEVEELANAQCVTARSGNYKSIQVTEDTSLDAGTATITVSNSSDIQCKVSSYYGFEAVVDYFNENGCVMMVDGTTTVNYLDSLENIEVSNKYAYNKQGNYRFMFYNVLWDMLYLNYEDNTRDDTTQRGVLQAKVIEEYAPDVIGLQERDDTRTELAGYLEDIGYTELATVSSDTENETPLFYNANTMTPVSGTYGQRTFENQYNSDTKSMNYCVFQSVANKEYIITVSTHLCTQDATIRLAQAEELLDIVDGLIANYPGAAVVIGGDYNIRPSQTDYSGFINLFADYSDAKKTSSVLNSIVRTDHGYPSLYEFSGIANFTASTSSTNARIMSEGNGENDNNGDSSSNYIWTTADSVDHVLYQNMEPQVYGVVVDDCTRSASDHFPVFVDFSLAADEDPDTLNASELYKYGTFYANNGNVTGTTITETLTADDTVEYSLTYGGLKSLYVPGLTINTADYNKMEIRIRTSSNTTSKFTRYRLYLNTSASDKMDTNKVIDTGGSPTVNASALSYGTTDANGWFTVTIDLSSLSAWTGNTTIYGFNFGFVNADATQEISYIKFSK